MRLILTSASNSSDMQIGWRGLGKDHQHLLQALDDPVRDLRHLNL